MVWLDVIFVHSSEWFSLLRVLLHCGEIYSVHIKRKDGGEGQLQEIAEWNEGYWSVLREWTFCANEDNNTSSGLDYCACYDETVCAMIIQCLLFSKLRPGFWLALRHPQIQCILTGSYWMSVLLLLLELSYVLFSYFLLRRHLLSFLERKLETHGPSLAFCCVFSPAFLTCTVFPQNVHRPAYFSSTYLSLPNPVRWPCLLFLHIVSIYFAIIVLQTELREPT